MEGIWYFLGGSFGFTLVVGLFGLYYYNRMTGLKVRMEESLRTIDVLVDRRHTQLEQVAALLRRLELAGLDEVQVAMDQSRKAMAEAGIPGKAQGLARADEAIQSLLVISAQHQELRKHSEFDPAQRVIEKTNVEIDGARRYFNALVRDYNLLVQRMPSALYAMLLRMQPADYLEIKS